MVALLKPKGETASLCSFSLGLFFFTYFQLSLTLPPGNFLCLSFLSLHPSAAVPLDQIMGHDDLGGQQVRVLDVVDHLRGGLDPQLEGIDIDGGQLGGGEPGEQGVVEGNDGQILRDGEPGLNADPLQGYGQDIVADHDGRGPVVPF